MSATYPPFQQM